jgi:acetylglutamate kinase
MNTPETMNAPHTVVKIGGRAAADPAVRSLLAADLAGIAKAGHLVLVHGGGAQVTEAARAFGIESVFRDGVRVTSEAEMPVVDMVLAGAANKEWVRTLRRAGVNACGVSGADGGLVVGIPESGSRTAHVASVDTSLLQALANAGFTSVVSSVASTEQSVAVNINADEVAPALAVAVRARELIFLSDIPGVLDGGEVLQRLDPPSVEAAIAAGTISGGMIPKVRASVEAVRNGVGSIVIGSFERPGDIGRLVAGDAGTRIIE